MINKYSLETCSDFTPSSCIIFTGELVEGSYITLHSCDSKLNSYLKEIDRLIKEIKDNENILINDINGLSCSFSEITNLLQNSSNIIGDKIKTSSTIVGILNILCSMQSKITNLENGGFFDLPLPDSILDNLKCLSGIIDDPCDGPIKIKTLKDLILIIIKKLCP